MNAKEHLLYQDILKYHNAYDCVLNAFERALRDHNIESAAEDSERSPEFAANLIAKVFDSLPPETVEEYINLGRKEKIARSIMHFLNNEEYNTNKIQTLLEEFSRIPAGKIFLPTTMTLDIRVNLISHFISNHLAYISIAKNYINMRDIASIIDNSVAVPSTTGMIGGKSGGMLLANRILRPTLSFECPKELEGRIEEIESWYIRSSIINEFIANNQLEECHSLKYIEGEEFDKQYKALSKRFMKGAFSPRTIKRFRSILDKTRGCPLILRSSSFLEDSVGCSFSGKYDSFFISNRGSDEERLQEFTDALKKVYLSLYGSNAIQYRKDNQLLDYNEKMSVLVQRVVGHEYGKYFFPAIGIVGFSRNPYCWNKRIKPEDGMLRMVMGLGTRAVDRVGDDYPRIVSLSAPNLRPEVTEREKIRYSQKYVDVLNLETREIETVHFVDLVNYLLERGEKLPLNDLISVEKDGVLARPMFFPEQLNYEKCAITFDGILSQPDFTKTMKYIFSTVEKAYNMPVDMEFVYDSGKIYVLQCRSLSSRDNASVGAVEIPETENQDTLFRTTGCIRSAILENIDYVVYIDAEAYAKLPSMTDKHEVARLVGIINRALAGKRFILLGPGRWGSSNPELGISIKYGGINHSAMLIEVGFNRDGITPELSYGTHFFQDLVEANIIPLPLFPEQPGSFLNLEFLKNAIDHLPPEVEMPKGLNGVIKVINISRQLPGSLLHIRLDAESGNGVAYIAPRRLM